MPGIHQRELDRRAFVRGSMFLAAGAALSGPVLDAFTSRLAASTLADPLAGGSPAGESGYGPITPKRPISAVGVDADVEWLALPEGFEYAIFGVAGTTMSDGNVTPYGHDGMGAFPARRGRVRLVRNHEVRDGAGVVPPLSATNAYDELAGGGTTTLEVAFDRDGMPEVVRDFVSLSGTHTNCAGGITPWKSWLSCEETTVGSPDFGESHGYVFDVPAAANGPVDPVPLRALGRFDHEAVCVDPRTGIVYETEDSGDSGFYRFVPDRLVRGRRPKLDVGRLQMLKVADATNYDTRTGQEPARALDAEWVDIDEPDPPGGGKAVYDEGIAKGGAVFRRLEGCAFADGVAYFVSTDGGDAGQGQVWAYEARGRARGRLTLVFEAPEAAVMSQPDNLVVSPRGGILVCEDTFHVLPGQSRAEQHLRGLTPDGAVFDFARNLTDPAEWAGACWSPDGRYLFANTLGTTFRADDATPSRTYAIWGPWRRGEL
jgi:uncharacterized protein